jgi:hypothetical protein
VHAAGSPENTQIATVASGCRSASCHPRATRYDVFVTKDRPWFIWDVDVTEAVLRERLRHPDPAIRAQWQGQLMREATVREVWQYMTLDDVLDNWENIRRHLGRMRSFWEYLINGWREDGLLPAR